MKVAHPRFKSIVVQGCRNASSEDMILITLSISLDVERMLS
jgi:hypothetical protein